jgi:DNA repair exonuclease SbcCD ATPase subunit
MTLEESKEVIPMMEAMITQIEEQQNIMAEMLQEIQEKDEKLMCFQEQEERLQQLESELSELLQILPDTEELLILLEEKTDQIQKLTDENQQWQELAQKLNSENRLLQREKEKTHAAEIMTEECQDKLRQAEQERDYALSHQKKVEIPVEKPVLYQKCGNCNLTAYLKAKEKYDTQREKLAGRYKTKTAMYEALMFLLIWYSVSTTLFQMIRSKIFISDCMVTSKCTCGFPSPLSCMLQSTHIPLSTKVF